MSRATSVKEVLVAAKWMLENIGWCKFHYTRYKNSKIDGFCLTGAIRRVEAHAGLLQDARSILSNLIKESDPYPYSSLNPNGHIATWNDDYLRTKRQVISLLNKAIKKAQ